METELVAHASYSEAVSLRVVRSGRVGETLRRASDILEVKPGRALQHVLAAVCRTCRIGQRTRSGIALEPVGRCE